jgi:flavodoxin
MTRALIIFYSRYGNPKDVAFSFAEGMKESSIDTDI